MSEDEDKKELIINNFGNKTNINQTNGKKQNALDKDKTNENLINEFNEYFRSNNINKDIIFRSFNIDNNDKEFNNNEINQVPFILDKEQFYQSFVLFQKYIYWNMQKNYMQKINQEHQKNNKNIIINDNQLNMLNSKMIKPNKNNINDINLQPKNSEEEIENSLKYNNVKKSQKEKNEEKNYYSYNNIKDENAIINQEGNLNNGIYESKYSSKIKNKKIENYDETPIKTHKNFLELLELSLRNKDMEIFKNIYKGKIKLSNRNIIKKANSSFYSIDYKIDDSNIIFNNKKKKINRKFSFENKFNKSILLKNLFKEKDEIKNKEKNIMISKDNNINGEKMHNEIIQYTEKKDKKLNNKEELKMNKNNKNIENDKNDVNEDDIKIISNKKISDFNISPEKGEKKAKDNTLLNSNKKSFIKEKNISTQQIKNNNNKISSSNKESIIQQKIKELNEEIINFKEERNKICKLKEEYEKMQLKLIEDIQQFNDKKEEFEKYRLNEINKIKQDKKKYIIENRNINDIKLNYRHMVISSKKDKEIIKNLKNQISDLKNLIKVKPNKYENKMNKNLSKKINMSVVNKKNNQNNNIINSLNDNQEENKNILINNNNIVINTNNNSEIDEENEDNEIDYFNNNTRCKRIINNKKIKSDKDEEDFCTISDDLKEKERYFSSNHKNNMQKKKFNAHRLNSKFKNNHEELLEDIKNLKFSRIAQSQSNSKHKNRLNGKNKSNKVEHVKTENNFITVNINTNTFGNGEFYLKKNKTLNNNNINNRNKNSNKKNLNNSTIKRKNKFLNQKYKQKEKNKLKMKNNLYKNNYNSNTNSLLKNRRKTKKSWIIENNHNLKINVDNKKKSNPQNLNKNKRKINNIIHNSQNNSKNNTNNKQSTNRASYKSYFLSNENKEKLNNKIFHPTPLNKKTNSDFSSCISNSSSTKNKNTNRMPETKAFSISIKKQNDEIKNKERDNLNNLYNLNKININDNLEQKLFNNNIYSENYDFVIPDKYINSKNKWIKSINSNGKIINIYNNKKEIIFPSGVKKEIFDDGFQIVYFNNGDKKQSYPDGKTIYYFHEAKTIQTTFINGIQIFKFNNGQIEKHFPDKTKIIIFPDGTKRLIKSDRNEETYYSNDTVQNIIKNEILSPKNNS